MNSKMKKELLNDVLTGLVIAGLFAAIAPFDALAQGATGTGLSGFVSSAGTNVISPAMQATAYIAYAMGAVLVVAGIAGAKKHADNPSGNPLGPAIGKLGAGAAFLAAPGIVKVMQTTGQSSAGATSAQGSTLSIGF